MVIPTDKVAALDALAGITWDAWMGQGDGARARWAEVKAFLDPYTEAIMHGVALSLARVLLDDPSAWRAALLLDHAFGWTHERPRCGCDRDIYTPTPCSRCGLPGREENEPPAVCLLVMS